MGQSGLKFGNKGMKAAKKISVRKSAKKILCSDEQFRGPFFHRIIFASRCMKYLGSGRFISMKNRNLTVKAKNFRKWA
jgi:hypothetical protein